MDGISCVPVANLWTENKWMELVVFLRKAEYSDFAKFETLNIPYTVYVLLLVYY